MAKVLYLTYDGILEPLGQSQVLRYLQRLAGVHEISLISFEKKEDWRDQARRGRVAAAVAEAGIHWIPLRYHRRPTALATTFDVLLASLVAGVLVLKRDISVVHARSYVASIPALLLKTLFGRKFIFDMRGFWADERVERAGCSKSSALYRVAKWFERRFFSQADLVVSLTHAGVEAIRGFPYLKVGSPHCEVIPTCTDLDTFRLAPLKNSERFTLGYVGTADTAYLFEPVLRCFRSLRSRKQDARLLVVTRTPHEYVRKLLNDYQIPEGCVELKAVTPEQVPAEMARMHAGIFFVKPGFSASASVPTKLGEFLACGVPCLGNAGIGDLEQILEKEGVGIILREFAAQAEEAAVAKLLDLCERPDIRERCAGVARRLFSLEEGVSSYHRIYCTLAGERL